MVNYTKTSKELQKAWFKYKEKYSGPDQLSLTSFAAGWNAAQEEAEARRRSDAGWAADDARWEAEKNRSGYQGE